MHGFPTTNSKWSARHTLRSTASDFTFSPMVVQSRLTAITASLPPIAVSGLVDPGDELLGCWWWAFEVEDEGVDLYGWGVRV